MARQKNLQAAFDAALLKERKNLLEKHILKLEKQLGLCKDRFKAENMLRENEALRKGDKSLAAWADEVVELRAENKQLRKLLNSQANFMGKVAYECLPLAEDAQQRAADILQALEGETECRKVQAENKQR